MAEFSKALDGASCGETLAERRFEAIGVRGLARYVAAQNFERDSLDPVGEARVWFERVIVPRLRPERAEADRRSFEEGLRAWRPPKTSVERDLTNPAALDEALIEVRELLESDPSAAWRALRKAALTGLPAAGRVVREFTIDDRAGWSRFEREWLDEIWVDALLRRTWGRAHPEDPRTW
jgi:hypothetical protein